MVTMMGVAALASPRCIMMYDAGFLLILMRNKNVLQKFSRGILLTFDWSR